MDKTSRLYFSSYLPMLNVLSDVITKNFGRLLISKNASLVDSVLFNLNFSVYMLWGMHSMTNKF